MSDDDADAAAPEPVRTGPLAAELLAADAALLAGRQLPDRRPDLPAGQPAAARAAAAGAHQAAPARPLGHLARPELHLRPPQPADPGARRRRDLPGRAGPRRPGAAWRTSTSKAPTREIYPRGHAGRGGHAPAVPPVLDAGRHPQPRQRADARLDPRGRRARLRAGPRLRRGLRQPRPDRRRGGRRRRGGDRAAGGLLEGHQLPQPGARRRGAADPAPQRLQDRRPDRAGPRQRRRRARAARGQRLRGPFRRGRRPGARCTRRSPPRSTPATTRSARSSRRRATQRRPRAGRAGRRSCCARRRAGPGPKVVDGVPVEGTFRAHQVPLADVRDEPEQLAHARGVDAQLPARRAVRRERPARRRSWPRWRPRATGAWAPTRTPTAASCCVDLRPARLPRLRASPCRKPATERHESTRQLGKMLRDIFTRNAEQAQLPPVLPRRDQLQPARRRLRGREPLLRRHDASTSTTTCRPTAG